MLEVSRLRLWLLLLLPTVVAMLAARGETRFVITLRTGGLTRRNVSEVRALTVFDARRRRGGMDEGAHLALSPAWFTLTHSQPNPSLGHDS